MPMSPVEDKTRDTKAAKFLKKKARIRMSFTTKKAATEEGMKWLKTLPKGWALEVWENLGWHWRLINAPLSLRGGVNEFSCTISHNPEEGGSGSGYWESGYGETPDLAIADAVKKTVSAINKLTTRFGCVRYRAEGILFQCETSKSKVVKSKSRSAKRNSR